MRGRQIGVDELEFLLETRAQGDAVLFPQTVGGGAQQAAGAAAPRGSVQIDHVAHHHVKGRGGPGGLAMIARTGVREDTQVAARAPRSEEHTSELQSLMRNSYAVLCLKKKTTISNSLFNQN